MAEGSRVSSLQRRGGMRRVGSLLKLPVLVVWLGLANIHAEEQMPSLGQRVESKSYLLSKVSERDGLGNYDRETDRYLIRLSDLLSQSSDAAPEVKAYLARLAQGSPSDIVFMTERKKESGFSERWTSKESLLTVEGFEELSPEYDLNPYLGPFAKIPTRYLGRAQLVLRFQGEILRFQGVAYRKAMSLSKVYWAHYEIYLPSGDRPADLKALVLVSGDPNDRSGQNGTYLLMPKD